MVEVGVDKRLASVVAETGLLVPHGVPFRGVHVQVAVARFSRKRKERNKTMA